MPRYAAQGRRTDGGAVLGVLFLETGTTVARGWLYDVIFGVDATPADVAFNWEVSNSTGGAAAGTGVVAEPLDAADKAAEAAPLSLLTTNPTTINAVPVLEVPLNQRATFRWVAAPGGELVWPATAGSGLLIQHTTATAATDAITNVHFME